jgi:hypothetical protein
MAGSVSSVMPFCICRFQLTAETFRNCGWLKP